MKKKYLVIFAMAALICVLASCQGVANDMTVGIMPDVDSIPFAVAKLEGYLPENIRLELFMSPMDRDAAFYAGELDGTISDTLAACLMREGGYDVNIVSKTDGSYGVLTAEEIGSPAELEGMEIGMSLSTVIEYVTYRVISEAGGNPEKALQVSVPKIPSRLEMLFAGQIGAIAVPEPYVSSARERGAYVVASSDEYGINPGIMLFYKDSIDKKGNELYELYKAYNKAVDYIHAHKSEEFMPYVIEELGLPAEAINVKLPVYTKAVPPELSEITSASEWLLSKNMIENTYSYEDLVFEIKR